MLLQCKEPETSRLATASGAPQAGGRIPNDPYPWISNVLRAPLGDGDCSAERYGREKREENMRDLGL